MNLIIGILGRPKKNGKAFFSFSSSVTDVVIDYGYTPLGIIPPVIDVNQKMTNDEIKKLHRIIDYCDGFILQGGTDYYQYDIEAIKYIYEKNIPILGICLGMQSMGATFDSSLVNVNDHNHIDKDYAHLVVIEEDSKLYNMLQSNKIMVNSRHKEMLEGSLKLDVSAYHQNVIEAIEDKNSLFFIGVQWHPEDMVKYDDNSRKLFDEFFLSCNKYQKLKGEKINLK